MTRIGLAETHCQTRPVGSTPPSCNGLYAASAMRTCQDGIQVVGFELDNQCQRARVTVSLTAMTRASREEQVRCTAFADGLGTTHIRFD